MANTGPRAFIAAFQMSLDGYMQGANGEVDWVDSWSDALQLVPDADAAVLGGGMYPGYEQLWGSVAADATSGTAMLGRSLTDGEVEYADWTQRTPHYVLSSTLDAVTWENTHLVRTAGALRTLKTESGGAVYVVGGPSLVSNLIKERLIDELRLIVHPLILGGGKTPFGVADPQTLELVGSNALRSGRIVLTYRT